LVADGRFSIVLFLNVLSRAISTRSEALFDDSRVAVSVHAGHHGGGDAPGRGSFFQQSLQGQVSIPPGENTVGQSVCCCGEGDAAV
jgi:hypothetical protein